MNIVQKLEILSKSLDETLKIGESIGAQLKGGEVIELVGDIGTGKTALVRGLAGGAGSLDEVTSPSFTLSRIYKTCNGLTINHFDFYRLTDAGIMLDEVREVLNLPGEVVVIEWADAVRGVLPESRLKILINNTTQEIERKITLEYDNDYQYLAEGLK